MITFIDRLDARKVQDHSQTILDGPFDTTHLKTANIALSLLLLYPKTDPFVRGLIGGAQSIVYSQDFFSENLIGKITLISMIGSTVLGIYAPKLGAGITIAATLAHFVLTDMYTDDDTPAGSVVKDMYKIAALTAFIIDNRYLNGAYLISRIAYAIYLITDKQLENNSELAREILVSCIAARQIYQMTQGLH